MRESYCIASTRSHLLARHIWHSLWPPFARLSLPHILSSPPSRLFLTLVTSLPPSYPHSRHFPPSLLSSLSTLSLSLSRPSPTSPPPSRPSLPPSLPPLPPSLPPSQLQLVVNAEGGNATVEEPTYTVSTTADFAVKLRGLPYEATPNEILQFLSNINVSVHSTTLVWCHLSFTRGWCHPTSRTRAARGFMKVLDILGKLKISRTYVYMNVSLEFVLHEHYIYDKTQRTACCKHAQA